MDDKVLLAALAKLQAEPELPASQFTAAQRSVLDRFARQTGAVRSQRQGRGENYRIVDPALFATHFSALSPDVEAGAALQIPLRARHIARARDSKAGVHQHEHYYLLIKAVGDSVVWRENHRGIELPLSRATIGFGAATLMVDANDAWATEQDLWLVENQALFDRTDWLPGNTQATIAYYGGQLNGILLDWLGSRARAGHVMHFPDYDGTGLANFSRLHAVLGDACRFWLMPDWSEKLDRYGSTQLWRDTLRDFTSASQRLPEYLTPLTRQMLHTGRALEQEAVWLPGVSR
jgi:hypothetical protein